VTERRKNRNEDTVGRKSYWGKEETTTVFPLGTVAHATRRNPGTAERKVGGSDNGDTQASMHKTTHSAANLPRLGRMASSEVLLYKWSPEPKV
jgi:hypothetical protein